MTYRREDDRHARAELTSLIDKCSELRELTHALSDDLRLDDQLRTQNARARLAKARVAIAAAAIAFDEAFVLLPPPVVEEVTR